MDQTIFCANFCVGLLVLVFSDIGLSGILYISDPSPGFAYLDASKIQPRNVIFKAFTVLTN